MENKIDIQFGIIIGMIQHELNRFGKPNNSELKKKLSNSLKSGKISADMGAAAIGQMFDMSVEHIVECRKEFGNISHVN